MSATPTIPNPDDPASAAAADQPTVASHDPVATAHPDPITGEPGAHPVGVGVGALSAGAAGAAIGAIGGPIGVLIGAAIGAVAGGLAGKEVAATNDAPAVSAVTVPATPVAVEEPPSPLPPDMPTPITVGAMPGEGFRVAAGSGFTDDAGMTAATAPPALPPAPRVDLEDDALPMTAAAGLQAPPATEVEPLAGTAMPASGEEAVRVAAYYQYLDRVRSGQTGDAAGDWLDAEREMMLS